jgi:hypothetical protein
MIKKAQSSIEFTIIVGVMVFVLLGIFIFVQGRSVGIHKDNMNRAMEEVANIIRSELSLATATEGTYQRVFLIPERAMDYEYNVSITSNKELSISMYGSEYLVFTNENISGYIARGKNLISKKGSNITINSLEINCPFGAGTDDPYCGIIDCSGWYVRSGSVGVVGEKYCHNKENISSDRCKSFDECKKSNSSDCSSQTNKELVYQCGICQDIISSNCTGKIKGACYNYPSSYSCGSGLFCDGFGHCGAGGGSFNVVGSSGLNVASFNIYGDIILRGTCAARGGCSPPANSFVLKNSLGNNVAYIDNNGNMCVSDSSCSGGDANCNAPGPNSFMIYDDVTNTVVSYIDNNGQLCLIGNLIENGDP